MILLNHQHLYYFWVAAKEGSIARACEKLHLAQPTVSAQIIQLEKFLGIKLFDRDKKPHALTVEGRMVLDYANEIFGITEELLDSLKTRPVQKPVLVVGIGTQVSKQVSISLIETAHRHKPGVRVEMRSGTLEQLLDQLRTYSVDLVLSDRSVRGQKEQYLNIKIGDLDVDFMAAPALARQVKVFPKDLEKIPLLIPTSANTISQSVDQFLARHKIAAHVVAAIEDDGVLRISAVKGIGAAPLHRISAEDDLRTGRLLRLGRKRTGILKTDWLIVNKRRRHNALVQYLLRNFRLNRGK